MYVWADGEMVRELRGASGATAGEFAGQAGVSRDALRRVERNRGPVRVDTVRKIGHALDTDPRIFARAVSTRRSPRDPRPSRQT